MTIEAMKQALEALRSDDYFIHVNAIKALEAALEAHKALAKQSDSVEHSAQHVSTECVGEPVAWLYESPMPDNSMFVGSSVERLKIGIGVTPDTIETPLYTHPYVPTERQPKREWVELTDEEVLELWIKHRDVRAFARAIQALSKEKNT